MLFLWLSTLLSATAIVCPTVLCEEMTDNTCAQVYSDVIKLRLYPLLEQYNVDFLFAGHNHLAEYLFVPWNQPIFPAPTQYLPCQSYFNYYAFNQTYVSRPKSANGMHEVIIGSSGHEVDTLCVYNETAMAELVYGSTEWGFAEVSVSSTEVVVNYMIIESPEPAFTLVVQI